MGEILLSGRGLSKLRDMMERKQSKEGRTFVFSKSVLGRTEIFFMVEKKTEKKISGKCVDDFVFGGTRWYRLFYGQTETIELKDQIFGIAGLGIFGVAAIYLLIQWRKSAQWEMEWYEWGTVKEKTRYNSQGAVRRYDKKRYYIKVQTSERVIEGECEFETYKKVKSGEKVLVFEIGTKMFYAVHPL